MQRTPENEPKKLKDALVDALQAALHCLRHEGLEPTLQVQLSNSLQRIYQTKHTLDPEEAIGIRQLIQRTRPRLDNVEGAGGAIALLDEALNELEIYLTPAPGWAVPEEELEDAILKHTPAPSQELLDAIRLKPKELDLEQLRRIPEERIAAAIGGLPDAAPGSFEAEQELLGAGQKQPPSPAFPPVEDGDVFLGNTAAPPTDEGEILRGNLEAAKQTIENALHVDNTFVLLIETMSSLQGEAKPSPEQRIKDLLSTVREVRDYLTTVLVASAHLEPPKGTSPLKSVLSALNEDLGDFDKTDPDKERGLYAKWYVSRIGDDEEKHKSCATLVLDFEHDKFALPAAAEYMMQARRAGWMPLAEDIGVELAKRPHGLPHSALWTFDALDPIPGEALNGLEEELRAVREVTPDRLGEDEALGDWLEDNLERIRILKGCLAAYASGQKPGEDVLNDALSPEQGRDYLADALDLLTEAKKVLLSWLSAPGLEPSKIGVARFIERIDELTGVRAEPEHKHDVTCLPYHTTLREIERRVNIYRDDTLEARNDFGNKVVSWSTVTAVNTFTAQIIKLITDVAGDAQGYNKGLIEREAADDLRYPKLQPLPTGAHNALVAARESLKTVLNGIREANVDTQEMFIKDKARIAVRYNDYEYIREGFKAVERELQLELTGDMRLPPPEGAEESLAAKRGIAPSPTLTSALEWILNIQACPCSEETEADFAALRNYVKDREAELEETQTKRVAYRVAMDNAVAYIWRQLNGNGQAAHVHAALYFTLRLIRGQYRLKHPPMGAEIGAAVSYTHLGFDNSPLGLGDFAKLEAWELKPDFKVESEARGQTMLDEGQLKPEAGIETIPGAEEDFKHAQIRERRYEERLEGIIAFLWRRGSMLRTVPMDTATAFRFLLKLALGIDSVSDELTPKEYDLAREYAAQDSGQVTLADRPSHEQVIADLNADKIPAVIAAVQAIDALEKFTLPLWVEVESRAHLVACIERLRRFVGAVPRWITEARTGEYVGESPLDFGGGLEPAIRHDILGGVIYKGEDGKTIYVIDPAQPLPGDESPRTTLEDLSGNGDAWTVEAIAQTRRTAARMINALSALLEDIGADTDEEEGELRAGLEAVEWMRAYFLYSTGAKIEEADAPGVPPATLDRIREQAERAITFYVTSPMASGSKDKLYQALTEACTALYAAVKGKPRVIRYELSTGVNKVSTISAIEAVDTLYGNLWEGTAERNISHSIGLLRRLRGIILDLDHEIGEHNLEIVKARQALIEEQDGAPGIKDLIDEKLKSWRQGIEVGVASRLDIKGIVPVPELNGDGIRGAFSVLFNVLRERTNPDEGQAARLQRIKDYMTQLENHLARVSGGTEAGAIDPTPDIIYRAAENQPGQDGKSPLCHTADTLLTEIMASLFIPCSGGSVNIERLQKLHDEIRGRVSLLYSCTADFDLRLGDAIRDSLRAERLRQYVIKENNALRGKVERIEGELRFAVDSRAASLRDLEEVDARALKANELAERRIKEVLHGGDRSRKRAIELREERDAQTTTIAALRADVEELEKDADLYSQSLIAYLFGLNRLRHLAKANIDCHKAYIKAIGQLKSGKILEARPEWVKMERAERAEKLLEEIEMIAESARTMGEGELELLATALPTLKHTIKEDLTEGKE